MKTYPQAIRNTWAAANAAKCSAIWRVVDARQRALSHPRRGVREQAEADLPGLIAAKDAAIQASLAAKRALDAAEAAYFAEVCHG